MRATASSEATTNSKASSMPVTTAIPASWSASFTSLPPPKINPGKPGSQPASPSAQNGVTTLAFSSWCPKAIATIGRLPETLADRCIVIHMQRKTRHEKCERLRKLDQLAPDLRRKCARFVLDHPAPDRQRHPAAPGGTE